MEAINKSSAIEYIENNMIIEKNYRGDWQARFKCADGFCYSVSDIGTSRAIKGKIKNQLIEAVTRQTAHPIIPVVEN